MKSLNSLRDILALLHAQADTTVKRRVALALALVVAGGLLAAMAPLALKGLIDTIAGAGTGSAAITTSAMVFGAAYLLALGGGRLIAEARPLVSGKVEQRLYARLSRSFFRQLLDLRLEFHLARRTGAVTQTLSQAMLGCQLLVAHLINSVVPVIVEVVAVAIILVSLDQPVLVATFIVTAAIYLAIFSTSMVQLTKRSGAVSTASLDTHAILTDSLLNYETIKYFNAEMAVRERFGKATTELEAQWGQLHVQKVKTGLAVAATFMTSVAVCLLAAADAVIDRSLTIGGFVLANVYMLQMVRPLETLGMALRDISQAIGFVRPLLAILEEPGEVPREAGSCARAVRPTKAASLSFQDVVFGYKEERPVVRNLSLHVPAGRSVAIVGASGAGKSSLVRLMLRLYEPQRGRILLDRIPIAEMHAADVRSAIGLVPQDAVLFNDSIAYNIGIGKQGASYAEVERAARLAHLHDFIVSLPAGYETVVGERGLKISGGERQRIAIARAVIKRPRLYVFDEATSSLDSVTEAEIMRNLQEVSAACTSITIAHRLSTILHADEIVVLEKGQVAESGTHAELLMRDGVYARLWSTQLPRRAA